MRKAMDHGIEQYQAELNEKISFLEYLIRNYNDGRRKSFYCTSVNLLDLADLYDIKERIQKLDETIARKEKIKIIELWFEEKAKSKNIDLKLKKMNLNCQ